MGIFNYYSLSFPGRRESNQDACLTLEPSENSLFLAVADGMGGSAGGQVASAIVIETAEELIKKKFKDKVEPSELKQILREVFNSADKKIAEKIKTDENLRGMGTTLVCVLILGDKFVWGNIGDSRIYWYKDSGFEQISVDHTHIQDFKDKSGGAVSEELIKNYSHYLTRSIDGGLDEPDIFPDVSPYEVLKEGNAFLLCSDGLIIDKTVDNTEHFKNYLIGTKTLKSAAENLISFAFEQGSNDNISVVLSIKGKLKRQKLNIKKFSYPPTESKTQNSSTTKKIALTIIALLLCSLLWVVFKYNDPLGENNSSVDQSSVNSLLKNKIEFEAKIDSVETISPYKLKLYLRNEIKTGNEHKFKEGNQSGSALVKYNRVTFDSLKAKVDLSGFFKGYYETENSKTSIKETYYFFRFNEESYLLTEQNLKTIFAPIISEKEAIAYAEILMRVRESEDNNWEVVWNDDFLNRFFSSLPESERDSSVLNLVMPVTTVIESGNLFTINLIIHDLEQKKLFYRHKIEINNLGEILNTTEKELAYNIEKELGLIHKIEGN